MESKTSFVKYNNQITPVPNGTNYSLIAGKIYTLNADKYSDIMYLQEDKDFEFPEKYYLTDADIKFIDKVVGTFDKTDKLTTGVLFSGIKGSGKTLMAKKTAQMSNLPIIVVDPSISASDVEAFFSQIHEDVCVIFDEIDKYWSTRYMLSFLDGIKPSCKKLVLCTANNEKDIDEYLNDRCSRIRYKRTFDSLSKSAVKTILSDFFSDKDKIDSAAEFICSSISVVSYDNVIIFGEECKNNPDNSFEEILADLNVAKR